MLPTKIIIILFTSAFTWALMYFDSRLFDQPKNRLTYLKNIILANILVLSVIWLITWLAPSGSMNQVISTTQAPPMTINEPVSYIPDIGENILSGPPKF